MIPRRLLRHVPLVLLLAAGSCEQADGAAGAYDRIVSDLERGNLQQAEQLVQESGQRWSDSAKSPWHWRFRLLNAEVLIARGKAADARRLVDAPVPQDAAGWPLEARRLKILGHAALNLGQYEEATRLLEAASQATEAAPLPRLALELDVLRGLLLIRTNNQSAGETVTRAAYQRAVEQNDAYWQAAAANNLGLERMRGFRYDEAIPFLEQALKAAESAGAQRFSAASLANLGTCYYRIGDFDKALSFLQRAAESQERIGALTGLQSSLGDIGNVHSIQGHPDRAVPFYQRALRLARSSAPADAAKWAGNLARAHAELKQLDEAEQFTRESLTLQPADDTTQAAYSTLDSAMIAAGRGQHEQAIRFYQETIALAADNAELTLVAHAGLGEVYLELGAREKARTLFERCLQTIDASAHASVAYRYKLTFFSRVIEFYQQYVDVLVADGDHVRALEVAESSRALLLSERLQLDGGRRSRVTRAGLQEAAGRMNVVFLSYWLGPDRSFLWVVNRREFKLLELPPRDRIASLVDAYRAFIETSVRDPLTANFAPARQLYDILLAPARSFIPAGSHLVLVPDGPLHALNVETLPVFDESPHYFIEDATITVAPALALATASTWPRLPDTGALLLVGDPEAGGPDYPRLPNAAREIAAIRERFSDSRRHRVDRARCHPGGVRSVAPRTVFDHPLRRARHRQPGQPARLQCGPVAARGRLHAVGPRRAQPAAARRSRDDLRLPKRRLGGLRRRRPGRLRVGIPADRRTTRDRGTLGRQRPLDLPADGDALRSHSGRRYACGGAPTGEADADSRGRHLCESVLLGTVSDLRRRRSAGAERVVMRRIRRGSVELMIVARRSEVEGCCYRLKASAQNCPRRFAATCRRYSAVERRSSIGAISRCRIACASASDAPLPSACSVCDSRSGVGATLPIARRGRARARASSHTPATTTFAIACAARVPTLRNHWRPRTAGISKAHDQLVGPRDGLTVAGIERRHRHAPRAGRAPQHDDGVGGEQHRQRVAGRRRVRDVAADRAAILNLHAADLARRGGQHRQPARESARERDELGVGRRARRCAASVPRALDAAQRVELPQIEKACRAQRAEVERDIQVGAPGHRDERPLVAQHLQRVGRASAARADRGPAIGALHQRLPRSLERER